MRPKVVDSYTTPPCKSEKKKRKSLNRHGIKEKGKRGGVFFWGKRGFMVGYSLCSGSHASGPARAGECVGGFRLRENKRKP